eukprot:879204-Lingulodinium_polyedra.AAC.1
MAGLWLLAGGSTKGPASPPSQWRSAQLASAATARRRRSPRLLCRSPNSADTSRTIRSPRPSGSV